jgi:Bacterial Ig-like domain (group 1)
MSRIIPRRMLVVTAALVAVALAQALPALGADTITPSTVTTTLQAGASTTVNKTLHLDGLPPRADIIVAVDTTGSMGIPIAQAQADAVNICNQVQGSIPGARFAVMDFEDYPPPEGTGQAGDVPYTLKTPGFTSSCAVFSAAIATMTAVSGSGGDPAEAYNRAYFESYADGSNPIVLTRDPLATQFLVVLGDAAPHSSTAFGSCPAAPPNDLGRDGLSGTSDDLDTTTAINGLIANHIHLAMIRYTTGGVSVSLSCYQDMANATGGTAVDDSGAGTIGPFIIANAQAVPYTVNLQVSAGCQLGFTFSPPFPRGPFTGSQTLTFAETITAPTVPGNYTCTLTAVLSPGGPTTAVETVNVTVVPGNPATLTLAPKTASNPVDAQHCVTATVKDAFGNPTPGITVRFRVTGAVNTTGAPVTNAAGQAQFCYTGPALPGMDVITAFADTNNNGTQDAGEPSDFASKTWVLPTSTAGCKVTYGGRITAANGDKGTFGGNAMVQASGPQGEEEYQDHGPAKAMNVHSIEVQAVTCSRDGTSASIFGTATIDGAGTFNFRIDVVDNGEPGAGSDTYRIRLSNGYDSGVKTLLGGNIQLH